jgi:predicted metal-dependent HD superfamily phosphohydrolase
MPSDIATALGVPLLGAVQSAYASAGRHYHTWSHIEACLREAAGLRFDDRFAVYTALLFHDAVYVAGAKDNEARSAAMAAAQLREHTAATAAQIARIEQLILLTASHGALAGEAPGDDKLLVDIDLSILAASRERYDLYAAQVRDEWVPGVVTASQYAGGRAAFLRGMLQAPRVFHSTGFAPREAAARANIERELKALGAGL